MKISINRFSSCHTHFPITNVIRICILLMLRARSHVVFSSDFSTKSFIRYTLTLFSCLPVVVCDPRTLLITSAHEYSPSCNWRCRWDLNPGSDSRRTKRLATAPLQPYLGTAPQSRPLLYNLNNSCITSSRALLYPSIKLLR